MSSFFKISFFIGGNCFTEFLSSLKHHHSIFEDLISAPVFILKSMYLPDQGPNLGPLHWKCQVLATEPACRSPLCTCFHTDEYVAFVVVCL